MGLFATLGGVAGGLTEGLEGVAFDTWVVPGGVADRLAIGAGIDLELCGLSERALGDTFVMGSALGGAETGAAATDGPGVLQFSWIAEESSGPVPTWQSVL